MEVKHQYRLRVENCIGTIIDVHRILSDEYEEEALLSQFLELQQTVERLDMSGICEGDVLMVEQATNALLKEFREFFRVDEIGPVYHQRKN